MSPAAALHIQETMDRPHRVVVDDPGRRWGRSGGRERAGRNGLDLGDVEGWMHTEGWGESEANGTGVHDSLNLGDQ